jgi:hypothetical protein
MRPSLLVFSKKVWSEECVSPRQVCGDLIGCFPTHSLRQVLGCPQIRSAHLAAESCCGLHTAHASFDGNVSLLGQGLGSCFAHALLSLLLVELCCELRTHGSHRPSLCMQRNVVMALLLITSNQTAALAFGLQIQIRFVGLFVASPNIRCTLPSVRSWLAHAANGGTRVAPALTAMRGNIAIYSPLPVVCAFQFSPRCCDHIGACAQSADE